MAERTPRELMTREGLSREAQARANTGDSYVPPSTLPTPNPDPGKAFRWVATHVMGVLDPKTTSERFRDRWSPVKASDYPELGVAGDKDGNVEIGGLMLCSKPREHAVIRAKHFEQVGAQQMNAVDNNFMREVGGSSSPLIKELRSSVSRGGFGTGSK